MHKEVPYDEPEICSVCKRSYDTSGYEKWARERGDELKIPQTNTILAMAVTSLGEVTICEECYKNMAEYFTEDDLAELSYQFGLEYLQSGDLESSIASFQKSFEHITSAKALCGLGSAYSQSGNLVEAERAYSSAIKLDQNCGNARHNLKILQNKK